MSYAIARNRDSNSEANKLYPEDRSIHDWYRFVLSFPPHLVRSYLDAWDVAEGAKVLDPFCGTGTVLVESKKRGVASYGFEANPMAHFATSVKTDWNPAPDDLVQHARHVADMALDELGRDGIEDTPLFEIAPTPNCPLRTLTEEAHRLLLTDSISPLPLHKAITLLAVIERERDGRFYQHERLAFARSLVFASSNLHFGPEVGVGRPKPNAPVIAPWLTAIHSMADDLRGLDQFASLSVSSRVFLTDARRSFEQLPPESIDAVFTSPPYPNEKDYTRTTRLESVLLGFISSKADLRSLKQSLLRSNTRNMYKGDDDHAAIFHPEVERIARAIEMRRIELGKTSGFEKLYATVARNYFGGMALHLAELRSKLRPGAYLGYVVGDQASYLRVLIPTGRLLAEIADALGYEVQGIDLFRTRAATATKTQLREEVVVLRFPGSHHALAHRYASLPLGSASQASRSSTVSGASSNQRASNRYQQILEHIFHAHYQPGDQEVTFLREELKSASQELGIDEPLNLGDVPYSFRYRQDLPESIRALAPEGQHWIIRSVGKSHYQFALRDIIDLAPIRGLAQTKIPDATPGIVMKYAQTDEQGLLAKVRYNRLIDIFTGVTCYSLQSHLRTTVPNVGQVETDELYVGVDKRGSQYVFPVQAKGHRDRLGIVQIEQDFALCEGRFPHLICRPIAAQFMAGEVIALKAFDKQDDIVTVAAEKHYRLVLPSQISDEDLQFYRRQIEE